MRFLYTTISKMTEKNVRCGSFSREGLYELIETASLIVNDATKQFFSPVSGVFLWNGKDIPIVHHPSQVPIIEVSQVRIFWDNTDRRFLSTEERWQSVSVEDVSSIDSVFVGAEVVDPTTYEVYNREIEKIDDDFPGGTNNIEVTGVCGWIDKKDSKFQTQLATLINASSEEATLDSVAGLYARDVLNIGSECIIISEVSESDSKIYFDAGQVRNSYAIDTDVFSWGCIPLAIDQVTRAITLQLYEEAMAQSRGRKYISPSRLKSEKTDNYSYTLGGASGDAGGGGLGSFTGSVYWDAILQKYSAPPYIGSV